MGLPSVTLEPKIAHQGGRVPLTFGEFGFVIHAIVDDSIAT